MWCGQALSLVGSNFESFFALSTKFILGWSNRSAYMGIFLSTKARFSVSKVCICFRVSVTIYVKDWGMNNTKIQEKARVQTFKKIERNLNCSFLKIPSLTVFFNFIFVIYNVWNNAWEIYLFDTKQQFCYLLVVSSLTLTVPFNRACLEIR